MTTTWTQCLVLLLVSLVESARTVNNKTEVASTITPTTDLSRRVEKGNSDSGSKTDVVWILLGTGAIVLVLAIGGYFLCKYRQRKERQKQSDAERYVVEVLQQLEDENQVVQFLHMLELSSRESLGKEGVYNPAVSLPKSDHDTSHKTSISSSERMNVQIPPNYDELFTDSASDFATYNNYGFSGDDSMQWAVYRRGRSVSQVWCGDQDSVFSASNSVINSTTCTDVTMTAPMAREDVDEKEGELRSRQLQPEQRTEMRKQQQQQQQQQQQCCLEEDSAQNDDEADEMNFCTLSIDLNKMFADENIIPWYSNEAREKYIRALSTTSCKDDEVEVITEEIQGPLSTSTRVAGCDSENLKETEVAKD